MRCYYKYVLLIAALMLTACADRAKPSPAMLPDNQKSECESPSAAEQMFGINLHRLPQSYDSEPARKAAYQAQILQLEPRWVRALYWNPNNTLDRTRLHLDLAWARSHGLRVLMTFGVNSIPGRGRTFPGYDADDAAWNDYRDDFIAELNQGIDSLGDVVDAWQILNEPNQGEGVHGVMPPHRFGELTKAAGQLLRNRVPNAQIVSAGLVHKNTNEGDDGNGPEYLQRTITAVGRLPIDVFAFHAYGVLSKDEGGPDWNTGDYFGLNVLEDRFQEQVNVWQFARTEVSDQTDIKLWITEFGGPLQSGHIAGTSTTENYRQKALEKGFAVWRRNSRQGVERAFYFAMTDFAGHPNERLGLVTTDLAPKSSYHAFDDLTGDLPACPLDSLPPPRADNMGGQGGMGGEPIDHSCDFFGGCGGGLICRNQICVDPNASDMAVPADMAVPDMAVPDMAVPADMGEPAGDGSCGWNCGGGQICWEEQCVDPDVPPKKITIRAKAEGQVTMELQIAGQSVHQWFLQNQDWQNFYYVHTEDLEFRAIKIVVHDPRGEDNDLYVDSITINGETVQTIDNSVLTAGTWINECSPPGIHNVDVVHCDGGYFEFGH